MENGSERVQLAAAAAAHQLVIDEDQRKRNNRWWCVLTSGGVSCVMTVTKLDIIDDRVHEEGALRPRLVPLRVHEGGSSISGLTQPGCLDNPMATVAQCYPSFCINHQCLSSFMLSKKKTEIKITGNNLVQLPGLAGNNSTKKR